MYAAAGALRLDSRNIASAVTAKTKRKQNSSDKCYKIAVKALMVLFLLATNGIIIYFIVTSNLYSKAERAPPAPSFSQDIISSYNDTSPKHPNIPVEALDMHTTGGELMTTAEMHVTAENEPTESRKVRSTRRQKMKVEEPRKQRFSYGIASSDPHTRTVRNIKVRHVVRHMMRRMLRDLEHKDRPESVRR